MCLRHEQCKTARLIYVQVLQFLTHEGYVETARAFADEVYSERKALTIDPNESVAGFDVKEDEDARHRQSMLLSKSPERSS